MTAPPETRWTPELQADVKRMNEIPIDDLRKLVLYNPWTGELIWKPRNVEMFAPGNTSKEANCKSWNNKFAGKPALMHLSDTGYRMGSIYGKHFKAHRVIWALAYGWWPKNIDHTNHIKTDNRLDNLSSVDNASNSRNQKYHGKNISGAMGVWKIKTSGKWRASICFNYKTIHLGCYSSLDEAIHARKKAEDKYGFHPNHGGSA